MTERGDRRSDPFERADRADRHEETRKRRHRRRPCGGNTPSAPTGLAFEWETVERGRGRRLAVMLDWNPVRTNTSGASARMRRYRVQLQRSDDGGTTRLGRTRKWIVPEATVANVTAASIVSGTVALFTLDERHDLDAGDTVVVSGVTPAGYNGTWTALAAGLTGTAFRADIGSSPGAGTAFGEAHEDVTSLEVRAVRKHVWYRFRVQAENVAGCRGEWSSWTSWTLANDHVAPPSPLVVKIYEASTNRIVVDWDPPLVYLPVEGTVSATGTTTLTGSGTFFNAQVGIGTQIRVGTAGDVRTVTAIASDTSLTVDSALSTFSGETLYTQERDPDVDGYDVWLDTAVSFPAPAYKRDRDHRSTRISFRIPDADTGLTFYGRVRSFDASGNRSAWIPATVAGNSSSGATADGVMVGAGGGTIVATFTKPGRLRVRHYPARWTNQTGRTLTFKKARAVVGLKDEPPGSHAAGTDGHPIGSNVKINIRRWLADESDHDPVFQTGGGADDDDRLIIPAGSHKDAAAASTFEITDLEADESISIKVAAVGSTYPGDDLIVQVFME
jgi:hypothetical protein